MRGETLTAAERSKLDAYLLERSKRNPKNPLNTKAENMARLSEINEAMDAAKEALGVMNRAKQAQD